MNVSSTVVDISKKGNDLSIAFRHQEFQLKERLMNERLHAKKELRTKLENEIPRLESEHLSILAVMRKEGIITLPARKR